MYNPISCSGWESDSVGTYMGSAPCIKSKIGFVILFFLIAIIRRWGGEEMGMNFSFIFGLIFGFSGYLIMIIIFGAFKWAFVVGILGALVGGYVIGPMLGDGGE